MLKQSESSSRYLGKHTALSYIIDQPRIWRRIPYLKDNHGKAPAIILAVGDRRRVRSILRRLRNPVLVPEMAARSSKARKGDLGSTSVFGRVAMAIGSVWSLPVLVVETQMGAPATQIIMKEILSDDLTSTNYQLGNNRIEVSHKFVIRVGTAGGINCTNKKPLKIGDIVNATHSIGATGAVIQSLAGLDFLRTSTMERFREKWSALGSDFSITTEGHPRVECSRVVVEAIDTAGQKLGDDAYVRGGNITKDSLYAELSHDVFLELCNAYNCRSTEMELSAIGLAARERDAYFGMISGIIGILPDESFARSEREKSVAEEKAVSVAVEAIRHLRRNVVLSSFI